MPISTIENRYHRNREDLDENARFKIYYPTTNKILFASNDIQEVYKLLKMSMYKRKNPVYVVDMELNMSYPATQELTTIPVGPGKVCSNCYLCEENGDLEYCPNYHKVCDGDLSDSDFCCSCPHVNECEKYK